MYNKLVLISNLFVIVTIIKSYKQISNKYKRINIPWLNNSNNTVLKSIFDKTFNYLKNDEQNDVQ